MKKVLGVFIYFILCFLNVFLLAGWVAKLFGIGANQGLAAGAIVLFYAFIIGIIGLVVAIMVYVKNKTLPLLKINIVLFFILIVSVVLLKITPKKKNLPNKNSETEVSQASFFTFSNKNSFSNDRQDAAITSLGLFSPEINDNKPFYFYGNITFGKPRDEHSPLDSITFSKNEFHHIVINTAPPWLVPEHLKLDYEILFFKVLTLTDEFIEVEVNKQTRQTFWVSRFDGKLLFWPEFLLGVNSVELIDANQTLKATPFDHASEYLGKYAFLRPQKIKGEWMEVALLDNDFKTIGSAWLKWLDCGEIRVSYSLLS